MLQKVVFNGYTGQMNARFSPAQDAGLPCALILQPNLQHGNALSNRVTSHMFYAFVKNGFSTLHVNFNWDETPLDVDRGSKELADTAAALDWLQLKNSESVSFWIAGFSFGAWAAMQLLMRRPEIEGFVIASPAVETQDFSFLSPCPVSGFVAQGGCDTVVSEELVAQFVSKLRSQKSSEIEYSVISEADHFFIRFLPEFTQLIDGYLKRRIRSLKRTDPNQLRRDRKRRRLSVSV
jgi:alpha/beta superfamily hydrolase